MQMDKSLLFALIALAVGVFVGGYMTAGEEEKPLSQADEPRLETGAAPVPQVTVAANPAGVETRLSELQRRIDEEVRARRLLESDLRQTRQQLARLERELQAQTALAVDTDDDQPGEETAGTDGRAWFDEQALLDSGMEVALASELRQFFERLEMERLMLRDRSARENWERGRLREEMQTLGDREQGLRERLGDEAYDAYLYASGQTNRVEVSSVLESAQAGQAGIRSGDFIVRYDNERIYNWRDLRDATTSGEITDTIEVEVERDGETLQFYLARGPLGIRMNSLRVAP